jgi:hypothetical protein
MRKLLLSLAATVAILSPALAGDDAALDDVRFGAAISSVFNYACRPIRRNALPLIGTVLGGMTDQDRAQKIERAQTLFALMGKEAFCSTNEPLVRAIEVEETAT